MQHICNDWLNAIYTLLAMIGLTRHRLAMIGLTYLDDRLYEYNFANKCLIVSHANVLFSVDWIIGPIITDAASIPHSHISDASAPKLGNA